MVHSETAFLNICNLLELKEPHAIYPRGFPYGIRHKIENPRFERQAVPVHINAGLWLGDPDIDAITWLVANPHVTGFKGESVALGPRTWSPLNTQNRALRRDAIPAYYFVRMGYPISGMPIDRYGDIFSGYFVQACAKHLGGCARVGTPVADHRRNSHNYMKDAGNEWACILALEEILPWLTEARLEGNTYSEAFQALLSGLEDAIESIHGSLWNDAIRGYFHQMAYHARLWLKACGGIEGRL